VVGGVSKAQGLLAQYLAAFGTSHLGVTVTEAIVLRFFGSFFWGNFQLGFLLGGFGVQVFWLDLES
jgi:hypothetical protein